MSGAGAVGGGMPQALPGPAEVSAGEEGRGLLAEVMKNEKRVEGIGHTY